MADKRELALAVASGKSNKQISQETGVSPSYISQLGGEDSFNAMVEEAKKVLAITKDADEIDIGQLKYQLQEQLDDTWDTIEELAVMGLKDKLALAPAMRTQELLSIAAVANKAIRKTQGSVRPLNEDEGQKIIQVNISNVLMQQHTVINTVINDRNQVVEVGGTPIVNLSKDSIYERLQELKNGKPKIEKSIEMLSNEITADDL